MQLAHKNRFKVGGLHHPLEPEMMLPKSTIKNYHKRLIRNNTTTHKRNRIRHDKKALIIDNKTQQFDPKIQTPNQQDRGEREQE